MQGSISEMISFIYVADLKRSQHFYEDILGFKLVLDQGPCRIVRVSDPGGYLGYCRGEGRAEGGQKLILTMVTQRVDNWYEYLVGQGVQIKKPPEENPQYNIYHFFFSDPDGYQWEIQKFLDKDWNR